MDQAAADFESLRTVNGKLSMAKQIQDHMMADLEKRYNSDMKMKTLICEKDSEQRMHRFEDTFKAKVTKLIEACNNKRNA